MLKKITPGLIADITRMLPDEWLHHEGSDETPEQIRQVYTDFLTERLKHSQTFTQTAIDARKNII